MSFETFLALREITKNRPLKRTRAAARSVSFDESKHRRGADGKFRSKPGAESPRAAQRRALRGRPKPDIKASHTRTRATSTVSVSPTKKKRVNVEVRTASGERNTFVFQADQKGNYSWRNPETRKTQRRKFATDQQAQRFFEQFAAAQMDG